MKWLRKLLMGAPEERPVEESTRERERIRRQIIDMRIRLSLIDEQRHVQIRRTR